MQKNKCNIVKFLYKIIWLILIISIVLLVVFYIRGNVKEGNQNMSNIVVSMTTIPERIKNKTIDKTLNSLLKQTIIPDIIYINVPKVSKKKIEYPIDELESIVIKYYPNLNVKINIVEKDLGPITKVIPILPFIKDTDIVILVDDDMDYIPEMISQLISSNEKAVGYAGRLKGLIYRNGKNYYGPVEFLETFAGVLYSGELLKGLDKFYNNLNKNCINQDDIIIGKFLNLKNVFPKIAPNLKNPGIHDANGTPELREYNLVSGNEQCYNYLFRGQ
jgi:hypothetical protein